MHDFVKTPGCTEIICGLNPLLEDVWIYIHSPKRTCDITDEDYTIISIQDNEVLINNLPLQYSLFILDGLV